MSKITCDAVKCVFNTHGGCTRGEIEVEGNCNTHTCEGTHCDSFSDKIASLKNSACTDGTPCESSKIECDATSCVYNKNESCTAESIHVGNASSDSKKQTECHTFKEKNA